MRVGVVAHPPWVVDHGTTVDGIEASLVDRIAASIGSRVEWVRMPEFELIRALHRREIHLVIGGFDRKVSWAPLVAVTRPYLESPDGTVHVLAAPPGENAWLMLVERQIESSKDSIPAMLAGFR